MNNYRALPADGFDACWATGDGTSEEAVRLDWDNEAWTATGTITSHRIQYVYRLSPMWQTRQFLLFRDLDEPDLWLGTDGNGRWGEVNGAHRVDLDGVFDLVVEGAQFSHAVPIRRLPLDVGQHARLTVAVLDVETLGVVPTSTTYARIASHRWAVTSGGDTIEFDVDHHGFPLDLGNQARRSV